MCLYESRGIVNQQHYLKNAVSTDTWLCWFVLYWAMTSGLARMLLSQIPA